MRRKHQNKPRNPVAQELRERGPKERSIRDRRNELREREAQRELMDWYGFLDDETYDDE